MAAIGRPIDSGLGRQRQGRATIQSSSRSAPSLHRLALPSLASAHSHISPSDLEQIPPLESLGHERRTERWNDVETGEKGEDREPKRRLECWERVRVRRQQRMQDQGQGEGQCDRREERR